MHVLLASRAHLTRGRIYQRAWLHSSSSLLAKTLQKFKLADIGEGITECEVLRWSVKPDSPVEAFDQLLEVQSDKASVEITSPFDGVVKELLVPEGSVAKVGQVICTIEVDDGAVASADSSLIEPVVGSSTESEGTPSQTSQNADRTASEYTSNKSADASVLDSVSIKRRHHPMDPNRPASTSSNLESVLATPAVRHFARSKGVDLSNLAPGSGKDGRIEKQDIEAFLSQGTETPKAVSSSTARSFAPAPSSSEDTVVELGRTRYGMWKAMEKSLVVPHFGYTTSLDLTRLHALLPTLNAYIPSHYQPVPDSASQLRQALVDPSALHPAPSPPDVPAHARFAKLTYLPILLKTLSKAMHAWPLFRSSLVSSSSDNDKPRLAVRSHADIALALSTPSGLYTPVLRAVDTHSVYSLSARIADIAYRGRQAPSGLTPADMPRSGATISVSNVGAIGRGEAAMPVLVPGGGVAIVALGRAQWGLEVQGEKDEVVRRLRLPVSWAADHRVVEGAEMAAFVEEWRGWVENPERLIAEGI